MEQFADIFVFSVRDAFVQVSAFVALTVLVFSYLRYQTSGRLLEFLEDHEELQPIIGGLLGLTPGCGGAIVVMPLYIRGSVSFGTVVATLSATAGDSAFVILAVAPEAAAWAYGMAFVAGVSFGYAVDYLGIGVERVDEAVDAIKHSVSSTGFETTDVASGKPSIDPPDASDRPDPPFADREESPGPFAASDRDESLGPFAAIVHGTHVLWWIVAACGLVAGVEYLRRGGPEVELVAGFSFFGLFTVAGLAGTTLSFFLYFFGREELRGETEEAGRCRESFDSTYDTLKHAAIETSMVTVWVVVAYLLYEYTVVLFSLNIGALAQAAGLFAPLAGVGLGIVPGCGPQIVFAGVYANGGIPFSALVGNAISQDGDALFPLMAIDLKAAIVATIYTTIPATIVSLGLYYFWPFADYGFGVMGG